MIYGSRKCGDLTIVWYLLEPKICGVGPDLVSAKEDLVSREVRQPAVGGVDISRIGGTVIARMGMTRMGMGESLDDALVNMVCPGVGGVTLTFNGSWNAKKDGHCSQGHTPFEAYSNLKFYLSMNAGLKPIFIRSGQDLLSTPLSRSILADRLLRAVADQSGVSAKTWKEEGGWVVSIGEAVIRRDKNYDVAHAKAISKWLECRPDLLLSIVKEAMKWRDDDSSCETAPKQRE